MTVSDFEQLYSAASRMLGAQGSPTWHEDRWPAQRRVTFTQLEAELTKATFRPADPLVQPGDPAAAGVGVGAQGGDRVGDPNHDEPVLVADPADVADPALGLVTMGARFPEALLSLAAYVSEDPDGVDEPLVLPGLLHTAITGAVDELAARIAPGRPTVAIGNEGAEAADALRELANSLRTALGLPPGVPRRILVNAHPVAADAAAHERLAAFAKTAADAVPAPDELGDDFSVRYDVAVAAADLRALIAGEDVPAWRERQPGIDPSRHLVTAYRWEGADGRPVDLADWAAELRQALATSEAPWRPSPEHPLPTESADRSWLLYPKRQALVTADLLDELAARLTPGTTTGLIHFTSYPLHHYLTHTLRTPTTEL
ncbi:hypothetical protein OG394_30615 [Kribbella sp. NBC_01245]|uniref:hypothetical protein n=1 Tax=Kribbella sp. NBC_01245 TaxID=2903578 RepID=UPI002E2E295A|nr:hypothetical protein [Kribbella sp. NBC_01245]